ncbi:nuclease-related domain-containing protein [Noviherbaspirillum galbum]|uniref:NERD domain-containing protein n=1 Tax=Noviherbaspirillum galbum TaxID=2709383 RepID=A0A6B3SH92_9BURK|nr:nuclease-related domain-containing protein [Noviherbaspirillum galbum]NEX60231.1 NERD domain-containing protein [Noviherbaspirillum galbum]
MSNRYLEPIVQALGNALHQPILIAALLVGVVLLCLRLVPKGKRGELAVTAAKKLTVDGKVYRDLNNVTLATPTGTTQIDHVIVSRQGIFVIETKNMAGWIFGSENQPRWTQRMGSGATHQFQNPLHQNARHVRVLKEFLGVPDEALHSIVVFIGEAELKSPLPDNVMTGGFIPYIKAETSEVFTPDEVEDIVQRLQAGRMAPGRKTDKAHLGSLAQRHGRKQA